MPPEPASPEASAEAASSSSSVDSGNTDATSIVGRWIPLTALYVYVACRVITVVSVAVANRFTHNSLLYDLTIWDGEWFLRAARNGYPSHLAMIHGHVAANPIAFFPFYPLVIRVIALTGISPGVIALVVSAATGATAVVAVGLLARRLAGDAAGTRAALLFALCPGAFAFSLAYTEGIVITCVALGLIALLDRRWLAAGLLGLIATASSPVGLAFLLSCAWCAGRSVWSERRFGAMTSLLLAPMGFVAYMVFLWIHTGTLMAWRLTERGGWDSYPSLLYPLRIVGTFVTDPLAPTMTGQILFFGTVAAVIGVVLMFREHQPPPVILYGLGAVVAAAISQPVGLRPRFLMLAFPLIIALATRYQGRTYRWLVALSALLLTGFTVLELASRAVFP